MKTIFILLAAFLFSSINARSIKQDDWIYLFDGKSTSDWHAYGKSTVGKAWKVEDSVLYLDASNTLDGHNDDGGDIVTDKEYGNFHLILEWKISEGGNSGIIFYVHEDTSKYKSPWETGPEMQILDDEKHPDGKFEKHRAGDLYDLISASKDMVNPPGNWNKAEIISKDSLLKFIINGQEVLSTKMWDDNWDKMVAGSKFSSMPGFGKFRKGKISLQDHGNSVWFRNIRIREQ